MTRQGIYDRITELELYREGLRAVGKLTETQAREIATELRQLRNAYQEIRYKRANELLGILEAWQQKQQEVPA